MLLLRRFNFLEKPSLLYGYLVKVWLILFLDLRVAVKVVTEFSWLGSTLLNLTEIFFKKIYLSFFEREHEWGEGSWGGVRENLEQTLR